MDFKNIKINFKIKEEDKCIYKGHMIQPPAQKRVAELG